MFDLISIGDVTTDHLFKISEAHLSGSLKKSECEICLPFAEKIPVEQYAQVVAGNNANNSVGAARLGVKTAIYCHVGSDADGERILKKLKDEHIDTRYAIVEKGMNSNVSAVIDFQGERTILVYHQPWNYHLPDLERTKWIYLSSMSQSFTESNIINEVASFVERFGAKMFFNPGTYQMKYGVKKLSKILSLTKVFIVNLQEAKDILGESADSKTEVKKLLKRMADLGPENIVITDGARGSFGFDGEVCYQLDPFPAERLEVTGAGDAYAAGLLAAMVYGKGLAEAMRWGTANSASVIEYVGPQAGLLTYEKLQLRLKSNAKIETKRL